MAFDRKLWELSFTAKRGPAWPCPVCRRHSLRLEKNTLKIVETHESRQMRKNENWEVGWIERRFVCLLRCSDRRCREPVSVNGYTHTEEFEVSEGHFSYNELLHPLYVQPPVEFFKLPDTCPGPLKDEIRKAFSLFWCDQNSAANRIRASVELLMDHLGIKKQTKAATGNFVRLSLHHRVEVFQKRDSHLGGSLQALKWIGNIGSHVGELTHDDLYDAFEILSHVLDEMFSKRSKRISNLAKAINKSKGPLSTARRKRKSSHNAPF